MISKKKKILIISMTGGFGHLRAGQALFDYAKENLPDIEPEHIDIASINPSLKKFTIKAYDFISRKIPFIWGGVYNLFDVKPIASAFKKIGMVNWSLKENVENYLYSKKPDGIIFTNVVPLPFIAKDCRKMFPNIKMGLVVTDYHGHSYYYFTFIDYYFVANAQVASDLEKVGIAKEKIVVTGIPIDPKFYLEHNIQGLKLKYGIKNNFPVALLMASFKISKKDLIALVKKLLSHTPEINLIFIANGNNELYESVKNIFFGAERFLAVKWTDAIEEYMTISDVVISKAGGLTVSECVTLKKPMIMVNPIPGQEEYNAEYVKKNNFGVKVEKLSEITELLSKILSEKNNQPELLLKENPSKKLFQYFE